MLRALRTAFCRNLPTSAMGHGSGTVCLISACTGPAYIHRSMHAYWQLPSRKGATKSCEVTCRELTPKRCKNGMCRKCLFYGKKWPFYGRKCTFYGLSTVCLRSLSVTSNEQRAHTSSTNLGFTTRPDVNILILQCVSPSAESSTPDLHRTFRSGYLLAYGFPEWFACGMSMICLRYVYGLSIVNVP